MLRDDLQFDPWDFAISDLGREHTCLHTTSMLSKASMFQDILNYITVGQGQHYSYYTFQARRKPKAELRKRRSGSRFQAGKSFSC